MSKILRFKIQKLHRNSKIKTLGFVWSFKILTTKVVALNSSSCFEDIISISLPFKRHIFCQNATCNCGVIRVNS